MKAENLDSTMFLAHPITTPFPLYTLLAGLIVQERLEIAPGVSLSPIDAIVFSHPMLSIGPQATGRPSPGPWAQVYGASQHHVCSAELRFEGTCDRVFPRSPQAIVMALAAIRLSCPKFVRCVVAAAKPFTAENIAAGMKPVAVELHFPQSGPFDRELREVSALEARLLETLGLPVAHAFQEATFFRAYQIFDQAQWCTSPDAALALIWSSIEHLLQIGDQLDKGNVMSRAIALRLHGLNRSGYSQCVSDTKRLYQERGRSMHGGQIADTSMVGRSFALARRLFRSHAETLWANAAK